MQRPAAAVLTFPLSELTRPGPVMAFDLAIAGIGVEVVAAGDVPCMLDGMSPSLRAHLSGDVVRRLERPEILLAVRCSNEDVDLALLDGAGQRLELGGGHTGDYRYWSWERQPWLENGVHRKARPEDARFLEVRIPVTFRPRSADPVEALRGALAELLPPELSQPLLARFDPAIRAKATPVERYADIPLGASRLNGRPDVPADFEWPCWPGPAEADGYWTPGSGPLTFAAQINLAELPRLPDHPLPTDGWLLFFVDAHRATFLEAEDQAAHRVVYLPADVPIAPRQPPSGDPCYAQTKRCGYSHIGYGAPAVLGFEEVSSPPFDAICDAGIGFGRFAGLHGPELLARSELDGLFHAAKERQHWHQLLGQANSIQEDPIGSVLSSVHRDRWTGLPDEDRADAVRTASAQWRLLFQLVDEFDLDMDFDGGCLWFVIRSDDLAAGRFDRTLVEYQR